MLKECFEVDGLSRLANQRYKDVTQFEAIIRNPKIIPLKEIQQITKETEYREAWRRSREDDIMDTLLQLRNIDPSENKHEPIQIFRSIISSELELRGDGYKRIKQIRNKKLEHYISTVVLISTNLCKLSHSYRKVTDSIAIYTDNNKQLSVNSCIILSRTIFDITMDLLNEIIIRQNELKLLRNNSSSVSTSRTNNNNNKTINKPQVDVEMMISTFKLSIVTMETIKIQKWFRSIYYRKRYPKIIKKIKLNTMSDILTKWLTVQYNKYLQKKKEEEFILSIRTNYCGMKIYKYLSYHYQRKYKWKKFEKKNEYNIKSVIVIQSLYRKRKTIRSDVYWTKQFQTLLKKRKSKNILKPYKKNLSKYLKLSYQSIIGSYSIKKENEMIDKDNQSIIEYFSNLWEKTNNDLLKEYNKKKLSNDWIPEKDQSNNTTYYFNLKNGKTQFTNPNMLLYQKERDEKQKIVDHMRQKRLNELKEYKKQINEIGKNQLKCIESEILLMFHL